MNNKHKYHQTICINYLNWQLYYKNKTKFKKLINHLVLIHLIKKVNQINYFQEVKALKFIIHRLKNNKSVYLLRRNSMAGKSI